MHDIDRSRLSEAEKFALEPPEVREAKLKEWKDAGSAAKEFDWSWWQRPDQRPPEGDWRVWLAMAGRGFGKTRMGAEWVRGLAETHQDLRIALVGATMAEVRSIMIEGESGVLSVSPKPPLFEPSLKQLRWPNGTIAQIYSAAEPEGLRGGGHDFAWADELGKWGDGETAWDNLMLALRRGHWPRAMVTTTPRPVPLLRRLLREKDVARTGGSTLANKSGLAGSFLATTLGQYAGTRLGRQELDGELIEDVEGALWSREMIEKARAEAAAVPEMVRVVIGVDPPATSGGDACGIVVVGLCRGNRAWVLADASVQGKSPEGWARAVAEAADRWQADRVIAESNNGGEMVEAVLRAACISLPVKRVTASRGKVARAEPVFALYEAGRVKHAGAFPTLEDELCGLLIGGGYEGPGRSPDRADALVWAVSELMLGKGRAEPRVRVL
jgi:phage terminase large subunit-like protein